MQVPVLIDLRNFIVHPLFNIPSTDGCRKEMKTEVDLSFYSLVDDFFPFFPPQSSTRGRRDCPSWSKVELDPPFWTASKV